MLIAPNDFVTLRLAEVLNVPNDPGTYELDSINELQEEGG
jgi:hypothetical protein